MWTRAEDPIAANVERATHESFVKPAYKQEVLSRRVGQHRHHEALEA